ncbi:MAG: hypothetical protein ACREON_03275 [Gemmatimonadaceae bacterium]
MITHDTRYSSAGSSSELTEYSGFHIAHESSNEIHAFAMMRFQQEVPAFENVNLDCVEIATVGHDLFEIEEAVVPPPEQKAGWLVFAVISLDGREASDVGAIILEDFELSIRVSGPRHALPVEMPALGRIETPQTLGKIADVLVAGSNE